MNYILSQISSFIGLLIAIYITHIRKRQHVLIWQIACNVTAQISYALLGKIAASTNIVFCTLQLIAFYIVGDKETSRRVKIIISVVCGALIMGNPILTYQNWMDLPSCSALLIYVVGINLPKMSQFRWCLLCNAGLWIVYDIAIANFAIMLTHGFVFVSTISAKWHNDWHKRKKTDCSL